MKKWIGLLTVILLVIVCATAAALGTYAESTKKEALPADHNEKLNKIMKAKVKDGTVPVSNAYYDSDAIYPPAELRGTSVNNRVSLSWVEEQDYVTIWWIYEKINGEWQYLGHSMTKYVTIQNVSNGEHTYGVTSGFYYNGDYWESSTITYLTLNVLNGSDKPGTGADIVDVSLTGLADQDMYLTVYDNTYLHIRTDSLTWFMDSRYYALVVPDRNSPYLYTSLGNDFYLRASKYPDGLAVSTYNYNLTYVDGQAMYELDTQRAYFFLHLSFNRGVAKVNGLYYKLNYSDGTATVTGAVNKDATKITIPATITTVGRTFKVTAIGSKAFSGMTGLKNLTIGKNVKNIGSKAFYKCKNLSKITIKTKNLTSSTVKSKAFSNVYENVTVKCPSGKKKDYSSWMPKRGMPSGAKYK